jgi:hypothetical protein
MFDNCRSKFGVLALLGDHVVVQKSIEDLTVHTNQKRCYFSAPIVEIVADKAMRICGRLFIIVLTSIGASTAIVLDVFEDSLAQTIHATQTPGLIEFYLLSVY